jgi:hypothetical protein
LTVPAVDTVGAGDAFCGSFCSYLSAGQLSIEEAARKAVHLASLTVCRKGAQDSYPLEASLPSNLLITTTTASAVEKKKRKAEEEATAEKKSVVTFVTGNKKKLEEVQVLMKGLLSLSLLFSLLCIPIFSNSLYSSSSSSSSSYRLLRGNDDDY